MLSVLSSHDRIALLSKPDKVCATRRSEAEIILLCSAKLQKFPWEPEVGVAFAVWFFLTPSLFAVSVGVFFLLNSWVRFWEVRTCGQSAGNGSWLCFYCSCHSFLHPQHPVLQLSAVEIIFLSYHKFTIFNGAACIRFSWKEILKSMWKLGVAKEIILRNSICICGTLYYLLIVFIVFYFWNQSESITWIQGMIHSSYSEKELCECEERGRNSQERSRCEDRDRVRASTFSSVLTRNSRFDTWNWHFLMKT